MPPLDPSCVALGRPYDLKSALAAWNFLLALVSGRTVARHHHAPDSVPVYIGLARAC
jgi:hypothetical protein